MEKWNLIIDVARCGGCNNCALAAKDEHVGNDFPGYSAPHAALGANVISVRRKVRGSGSMLDTAHLPSMCNHCDNAPCLKAGADGAVRKRSDGIVIIDPVKARGRRDLVDACPYGAIVWNEEQQLPQTWIFDAHLLDQGWKAPRCEQVCPTNVFEAVRLEDDEMQRRAKVERLAVLKPELGTKPRVYYRTLHRYTHCFIGGSVWASIDGVAECIEGASVVLRKGVQLIANAATDVFGEFRFDGLAAGSGVYEIDVTHAEHGQAIARATLGGDSINVGELRLAPNSREET